MISGLVLQLSQWTPLSPPEKALEHGRCPLPLGYRPECSTISSKGEQISSFLMLAAAVWDQKVQRQDPAGTPAVGEVAISAHALHRQTCSVSRSSFKAK